MPIIFKGVNEGEYPMDLVASHQRILVAAAMRTVGPMLELGCGWYSTPILHEIAVAQKRMLYTYDNNEHWLEQFKASKWGDGYGLRHYYHQLHLVEWWGDVNFDIAGRYGLCFVDNSQPCEREYLIRRLIDKVDVFVLHDTEEGPAYGYNRVIPMFKYQWTDKCQKAWTTICSNNTNVVKWDLRSLPPCEPSKEVT